ncbi:MAG: helix-turn-helix domain-containing protein, partial [Lachnospiraceae bacterium]|nr:helix-turn-helix domain-containing protein [Lachnospiraceae bacterium]
EMRKEQSLTQRELAEKLNISDKTVSKWETGNGLPEVGLMLPLCDLLNISVNELLSGERLNEKQYYKKAEENIMDLLKEKAEAKKKIIIAVLIVAVTLIAGTTIIVLAALLEMKLWLRIFISVLAILVVLVGIGLACVLDRDTGVYECPHCGERFVPMMSAYIFGAHTIKKRHLKCPHCGKRSYCTKHLTKEKS